MSAAEKFNDIGETSEIPEPKPEPWPDPIPLGSLPDLPSFPTEALPSALRGWVEAEAEATQTPPDLAGMLALATVAAAAAGRFVVEPKAGWVEPVNLFTAIALPPGERKSAVFRDATAPLRDFERDEAERLRSVMRARLTEREILEKRAKKAIDKASKLGATEEDRDLAIELAERLDALPVPTVPRLIADDVTPERLAMLMQENAERMAVMSAEGGIFETVAGRYSDGVGNLDVFLKGHSGDRVRVDRVGRPPVILDNPALTMAIAFQPDVLAGLGSKPGFRGRGLLARFSFVLPTSRIGSRRIDAAPVPSAVRRAYAATIDRLLRYSPPDGKPRALRFTAEAQEAFEDFAWATEPRLGPDGDLHHIGDWGNKMLGLIARVAGLLTVADLVNSEYSEYWSLKNSVSIVSYLSLHFKGAIEAMGVDADTAGALHLLRWIRRSGLREFVQRDAQQVNRARFPRVADIEGPIRVLVEHGHIRELPTEHEGPGRKPSPRFEVHPLSHNSQNTQNSKTGVA